MRAKSPPQRTNLGSGEVVGYQSKDQRHDLGRKMVDWSEGVDHVAHNLEPFAYDVVESLKLLVQKSESVLDSVHLGVNVHLSGTFYYQDVCASIRLPHAYT